MSLTNAAKTPIFDPLFVFCGEENCYDILGVERTASDKVISKAYRELSRTVHPDKVHPDKRVNVTEEFRLISKAYEVLKGNESRPNFDFYLDHPRSYFKATGKHAWRALPKLPPVIVALLSMLVFSGFLHFIQINRHQRAAALLKEQVKSGLGPTKGGTKLAVDLNNKAVRLYEAHCKQHGIKLLGNPFVSPAAKEKMENDPKFDELCNTVLTEIKDWGDFALPEMSDLFIIKVFTRYPFALSNWARTYYRRYHSGQPLTDDDKEDMARAAIGAATWEDLSAQEKTFAVENNLWESEAYDAWMAKREGEGFTTTLSKRQMKLQKKIARLGGKPQEMQPTNIPDFMRDVTD